MGRSQFKRIPGRRSYERWYDWETGEITEYSDESLKQYLKRGYVKREIGSKTWFLLEHGLYPKFTETFQGSVWTRMYPAISSAIDINVARFARAIRDVKSDCKTHFGIRETTPRGNEN